MSTYYRVIKCRELKRRRSARDDCMCNKDDARVNSSNKQVKIDESDNIVDIIESLNSIESLNNTEQEIDEFPIVSDDEMALFQDIQNSKSEIKGKLQQWVLKNIDTLRLNVVTELLLILREKGHASLPKKAQALLGTKHYRMLHVMQSNRETEGAYMYLGIQNGLEKLISPDVYRENEISVLIHIDGMQIYNNSQIQVWPITVKIFHSNYVCKPLVAGIYCGDSKPRSSNDYLDDFVKDARNLTNNGVDLHGK